ncbi:MAG: hypothetical protein H6Q57_539 [Geobacteraceae bacterium]|nr:hypothetical protein [Geobacteraceae bacterium]
MTPSFIRGIYLADFRDCPSFTRCFIIIFFILTAVTGYPVFTGSPGCQVDILASLGAEWAKRVPFPFDLFSAYRTFYNHTYTPKKERGFRPLIHFFSEECTARFAPQSAVRFNRRSFRQAPCPLKVFSLCQLSSPESTPRRFRFVPPLVQGRKNRNSEWPAWREELCHGH